jgi:hypothetical protein
MGPPATHTGGKNGVHTVLKLDEMAIKSPPSGQEGSHMKKYSVINEEDEVIYEKNRGDNSTQMDITGRIGDQNVESGPSETVTFNNQQVSPRIAQS